MAKESSRAVALRLLSRREYSQCELERRLQKSGYSGEEISETLLYLQAKQWQSDQRFAESLVRRRSPNLGRRLILAELQAHHIEGHVATEALDLLEQKDCERAVKWLEKRCVGKKLTLENKAKWFRALLSRGFRSEDIKQALQIVAENLSSNNHEKKDQNFADIFFDVD